MEEWTNDVFISGSCAYFHTILIDKENDFYGFGGNVYHQTGNIHDTHRQIVPHKFTKKDIGIEENVNIVRVICESESCFIYIFRIQVLVLIDYNDWNRMPKLLYFYLNIN